MINKHNILKTTDARSKIRNPTWISIPEISLGDQIFIGVLGLTNDTYYDNKLALHAQGDYTVDWGDGTITNHLSDSIAEHAYDYDSLDVTLTSDNLKQVLVKLTPQVGHNLTFLSLCKLPADRGANANHNHDWYEVYVNAPYATRISISRDVEDPNDGLYKGTLSASKLVRAWIGECALTTTKNMFVTCADLVEVNLFDTSNVLDASYMFGWCGSIESIPAYNFSSCTNLSYTFVSCTNLVNMGQIITSPALTTMSRTFTFTYTLSTVPLFDTSGVTTMHSVFYQSGIKELPAYNTSSVLDFTFACNETIKLKTFPSWSFTSATTLANAFSGACEIREIPNLNLPACTNLSNTFAAVNASTESGSSIMKVGVITAPLATNWTNTFAGCMNLIEIEDIAAPSTAATFTNTLYSAGATNYGKTIKRLKLTGVTKSFNVAGFPLNRQSLVDLFTSLGTASGSQSITITGCSGAAALSVEDRAIATGKGWSIIG